MFVSLVVNSSCLVSENLWSVFFQFALFCIVFKQADTHLPWAITLGYVVVYKQITKRAVIWEI